MRTMADRIDEALRLAGRLVAFAAATAVMFFVLGIAFKPVFPEGLPLGDEGWLIYQMLLVMALLVAQILMVALAERGDWRHTGFGTEAWAPRALALAVGLGLLVQGLMPLVVRSTGLGEPGAVAWAAPTATLITVVVLTTLVDTLMLRGYVMGLLEAHWGEVAAIALTALVAALLAVQGSDPTADTAARAFLLAAFLGALRLRTGSTTAAWLAQVGGALIAEGAGDGPFVATAALLVVVTFLVLKLLPRTARPGRA
jgi:membrane protease YdiL (CAAX protease family)